MVNRFFQTQTPARHAVLMCAVSGALLAYEILLMRLLSIAYWHHFAYMVISIALLGLGGAGSLVFVAFQRIRKRLEAWLIILACATAVSFPLAFSLAQMTGLDPLNLLWQGREWFLMGITYLLMALPFVFGGGIVCILLTEHGERAFMMYGVNLFGSAAGALGIIPALFLRPPWSLIPFLGGLVLLGTLRICLRASRPLRNVSILLIASGAMLAVQLFLPPIPKTHHTKALPMTLALPDAHVEAERTGPLGLIHVVASSHIRYAPGLSLNFGLKGEVSEATLPEQKALFLDGEDLGPVNRFSGNGRESVYLDYTTMALPYHVRTPHRVLILGAGGGSDILLAMRHDARKIVALEINRQIFSLMAGPLAEFSGGLKTRPNVEWIEEEARRYLYGTQESFDLIQVSLVDSFGASAGGLHAAHENYLYTTQALAQYLSHLTDKGMLVITRWLKLPPRDSLRVIATALSALRMTNPSGRPERHLLFVRSWKTCTVLVSKSPLAREDRLRVERFCDERGFDAAYHADMVPARANRYDVLEEPYFFKGASALCGPDADSFLKAYPFNISPTTDDRPFFSHFFRWDRAGSFFRQMGRDWLPMADLGYLFVLATLFQAIVGGVLLTLLPLVFAHGITVSGKAKDAVPRVSQYLGMMFYFGAIGMGFMFIEMVLLPKYTLLLGHPIYSAAVVLSSILFFAGIGSLWIRRRRGTGGTFLWVAFAAIVGCVTVQITAGDHLFEQVLAWSPGGRVATGVFLISVLSFFLGWFFPSGLHLAAVRFPGTIPWAWATNGCASVIGAVLGKCLAMGLGFQWLLVFAAGLYFAATAVFQALMSKAGRASSF